MKYIATTIIGMAIIILAGWFCSRYAPGPVVKIVKVREVMTVRETQQFLNSLDHSRYRCSVDGIYGPETEQAIENYKCDQHYKESTYGHLSDM